MPNIGNEFCLKTRNQIIIGAIKGQNTAQNCSALNNHLTSLLPTLSSCSPPNAHTGGESKVWMSPDFLFLELWLKYSQHHASSRHRASLYLSPLHALSLSLSTPSACWGGVLMTPRVGKLISTRAQHT